MSVGFGYGLAHAASKAGPALNVGIEKGEAEDLRQRQMAVNEAAEARALKGTEEYVAQGQEGRKRTLAGAESDVATYGVTGATPTAAAPPTATPAIPTEVPKATSATPVDVEKLTAAPDGTTIKPDILDVNQPPPIDQMGNPIAQRPDGTWFNTITGESSEPLEMGVGRGGKGVASYTVPVKGAQPGDARMKMPPSRGAGGYGVGGAAQTDVGGGAGMSGADTSKMMQAKTVAPPNQGQGYADQASVLRQKASATQQRLDEVLKSVDQKYTNDPTMAAYVKAGIIGKVTPMVAQMQTNATALEHQGQMVDYMHRGSALAEGIISHLMTPGQQIDDKFIEANKGEIQALGFNPGILKGMHLETDPKNPTGKGFVVNGGGYIVPMDALMMVANPSLPWEDRAKAWAKMGDMYKDQEKAKADLITAYNTNPLLMVKYAEQKTNENNALYAKRQDQLYQTIATMKKGGTINVMGKDGKMAQVTVPPHPEASFTDLNWVHNLTTPEDTAIAKSILFPAQDDMQMAGARSYIYTNFSKSGVNDKPIGQVSAAAEAHARAKGHEVGYTEKARLAVQTANNAAAEEWANNPENKGKPFPGLGIKGE